eukprot:s2495_g11.t1
MAEVPVAEPSAAVVAASEGDEMLPLCDKCKTPMEIADMAAKKTQHAKQTFCKSCHSLTNMLQKHVDTKELFANMTASETTEFYQKALQERKAASNGVLNYQVVRSTLLRQMTKRVIETSKREAGGTFQPLSWWGAQGYNTEQVESRGIKEDHPVFDKVYRVDLVTVTEAHATETAEQTLVELEAKVRRKRTSDEIEAAQPPKRAKGKGKGKGKNASDKEEQGALADARKEISEEDKVLPSATGARSRNNEEKKAQREREQALKKENKIMSALAGKALPALKPVGTRLDGLCKFLEPKEDQLPAMTVRLLRENKQRLEKMVYHFQQIMMKVGKNQVVSFEDVTFTLDREEQENITISITSEKELQSEIKSLQECCKALQIAKKSLGK